MRWKFGPSCHGGSCVSQISPTLRGQRVWKRQPDGIFTALGVLFILALFVLVLVAQLVGKKFGIREA